MFRGLQLAVTGQMLTLKKQFVTNSGRRFRAVPANDQMVHNFSHTLNLAYCTANVKIVAGYSNNTFETDSVW